MTADYLEALMRSMRLDEFESEATIWFLHGRFQLQIGITRKNLMRLRLREEHDNKVASYLRWSATALMGDENGHELRGLTEYPCVR